MLHKATMGDFIFFLSSIFSILMMIAFVKANVAECIYTASSRFAEGEMRYPV
jgi:hypothetical protein